MSDAILTGFSLKPDLGRLKTQVGEYYGLQNIQGRGKAGKKRRGVKPKASFTSGVMGIFDLYNDGDPLSLNKFLVITQGGTFTLYTTTDLVP